MSQPHLQWHRLRWPREVEADQLLAISALLATSGASPVVLEAVGREGVVEHRLGVPVSGTLSIIEQLRHALPGLGFEALEERRPANAGRAVELRLSTPIRSLRSQFSANLSRALLTALTLTRRREELILQWQLLASLPPQSVGSTAQAEPTPMSVVDALLGHHGWLDAEARQALRTKRELPVWRALGHIAVRANYPSREQALLREVLSALRLAEAPGVRVLARSCSPSRLDRVGRSRWARLRLNAGELVAVAGWPIGTTTGLAIARSGSRLLSPSQAIPARGRVVANATFPGAERPLALRVEDALRHLHVLGPTGVGKSTLLLNLVVQDVAAGRGVVVVEPKGDLIAAILERVPPERVDDVVLFDPSENKPVGLNPLAANDRAPELVADELLGMFRRLYESSWGPRTNDILGASLLSLARTPGMTLCALPVLLNDPAFRHHVTSRLADPVALEPFWATFESWSEAERTAAIAPSLNRIRPFLMRPQLRAVLGQVTPRFDLAQVFSNRKVLLVNLAKGAMGAEAASLLGSLVLTQLWAAAQRQTTMPPGLRRAMFVYIDEFQDYLHLPTDLAEALAQARSLGVGFVLAHQHLSQLDASTRSGLLANARTRICFQLAADDARALANGALKAEDFQELAAFEVYARLVAEGAVQPWCSAQTLPSPAAFSNADEVRRRSRERYGTDRRTVDAAIGDLLGDGRIDTDDLTPRRRSNRGAP